MRCGSSESVAGRAGSGWATPSCLLTVPRYRNPCTLSADPLLPHRQGPPQRPEPSCFGSPVHTTNAPHTPPPLRVRQPPTDRHRRSLSLPASPAVPPNPFLPTLPYPSLPLRPWRALASRRASSRRSAAQTRCWTRPLRSLAGTCTLTSRASPASSA